MSLERVKGDRVGVGVESEGGLDGQVHDHETLGTQLVRQNFDGIADEQTGPGHGVEDTVNPDEDDHGIAGALLAVLIVEARRESPEDESDEHAGGGGQEHGPTADLVNKQGHGDRDDEGEAGLASRQTQSLGRAGDASRVVQLGRVVGNDGVTGPLGEDTQRDEDGQTVAVAPGAQEVQVAAGFGGLELEPEGLLDLVELELDGGMVGVAVCVILGEDGQGLVVLILGHQVTRRFGHPEDEEELDHRGKGLEEGRNTPGPVALEVIGAKADPGDNQGTDVPQAVVDGGQTPTVLRVSQFGEKHGRAELRERVAEAEQETAAHESAHVLASGLKNGTDDHDRASQGDGDLTAEAVGDDGPE